MPHPLYYLAALLLFNLDYKVEHQWQKKKKTALGVRDKGGTNLRILFSAFKLQSYSDIPSYYIPKNTPLCSLSIQHASLFSENF